MESTAPAAPTERTPFSPLMLADRLLTLAQDADRAGFTGTASNLVAEMFEVLDSGSPVQH